VTIFVFLVLGVIAVKDKSNQKEAGGGDYFAQNHFAFDYFICRQ